MSYLSDPLPPEWACLVDKVHGVKRAGDEWHSSCPFCGEEGHNNPGERPDRFIMWVGEKPRAWCRRCGKTAFPDQFGDGQYERPDAETMERTRLERLDAEEARKRSAERAIEHLRNEQLWELYHDMLGDTGRAYWQARGVPDSMQDWWQLGWIQEKEFWIGNKYVCSAASIPLFGAEWEAMNIKYRLEPAPEYGGKYRVHAKTGYAFLWRAMPEMDLAGKHVIVVEGEIKAMVAFSRLDDSKACVVAIPGTKPGDNIVQELRTAERVTLVMDPGAKLDGIKLAKQLGIKKTWLLVPPVKIDDGILAQRLTGQELRRMLNGATRLSTFIAA